MTDETLFAAALEKRSPAERSAFLDEACAGDAVLRRRVEALLRAHEKVGDYLERPAVEQIAGGAAPALARTEPGGDEADDALDFLKPSAKPGSLGRLGHYEILEVLGRGGFGIVLKAFDEMLHRVVAVKVMSPQLASTSPARKRFLREARASAAIRHDNVVGIYAVDEQPIPYLVMEYIAGETLQQKLDRSGPLEAPEVLRIGQQIASGLAAAHALGLIHRDVKPANILLENSVEQRVKITDFGLARAADDASLTQSGVVAGTPMYMAPEQARGEAIDQRADLFSLGSVLYVMCTGRPPFRASTTLAVLKRVAEDAPRPIGEIIPEIPNWLCAIIARLHAKNPVDRFASAQEVGELLARHLRKLQQDQGQQPAANIPPMAPKPAPVARASVKSASPKNPQKSRPAPTVRPPLPRKRRWVAAAAAILFLLFAGLGLSEATGVTNVAGTVIRLFSPDGTLVVEVDDPDVSVTIDGGEMVITGAGIKEIRLKPGQYKIEASKDGKPVHQELVTVTKNGRRVVRVSKETEALADATKEDKPGVSPTPSPRARQALDLKYIPVDASAAVVVNPRRIVQSPLAADALPAAAADEMLKELGVKPEQIEQVIVLLQVGAAGPAPEPQPKDDPPPDLTPFPGAVIRFAKGVDGKQVLTHLLKALREESHEGKTYYRSSTGEELLGLPLAGALPDERTLLVAPEPMLWKMLAADGGGKSPLLERLQQADAADDVTGVVIVEPYRVLLKSMAEPFLAQLPADLADAAGLPNRLVAATAVVNLGDKTLLKVSLEADSEESVGVLDKLAFKGLNWARKVYPDFRPTLLKAIPTEVVQPVLAVADQLFGGIQVAKEGKRLIVRLEKPESLDTAPANDLIASSGFNNHRGMNSTPIPGTPFTLDTPNREGGAAEPGWAGPWSADPGAVFQSKVVFEGDGALYLQGSVNGPYYRRRLAQPQTGRFQVEYYLQVPAGCRFEGDLWKYPRSGNDTGPNWGVGDGKFMVQNYADTGFKCEPGRWYKVTLRVDFPKQTWDFFVDDKRFETTQKLPVKVEYLDVINFIVTGGVYIDALRVTRLPDDATKDDLIASSGFNDASGMNSNPVPDSPYALDSEGKQGGAGEPGWAGPWSTPSSPQVSFQKKVTHEGDGALYMSKSSTDRRLAEALGGQFQMEMFVQAPAGGGFVCYLKNGSKPWTSDGPVWSAGDGKFWVLGDDDKFRDTGFKSQPGKWHKVTLRVDVPRNEWQFFVDDQKFETPRPLHFRRDQASLDTLWFQCETEAGVYIDAVRITREGLAAAPPKDLIASTGFNDAKGLNSNPVPDSPFILDTPNKEGGLGEPGWVGPWPASVDAVYQSKVVFEGDGALFLKGRPNFGPYHRRVLAQPQTGRFQIEYRVQAPAGTNYGLQIWPNFDSGPFGSGPISAVENGKFIGNDLVDTGFKCEPGRWYKVTMRIDVPKQSWQLLVDDKPYDKPLKFRAKVEYLSCLNFIVGQGGVYIDDLRVTRLPDADKKP